MRPERSFRFQFEVQVWGKILLLPNLLKEILADVAQEYWISLFIQKILSKKLCILIKNPDTNKFYLYKVI